MSTPTHVVTLESRPNPADIQSIVQGLVAYNASQLGGETQQYLVATVRDAAGAVVGGLFGATYMGWLHVQALWLQDELRCHGHGNTLMQLAEDEALRRGCRNVFVETLSFQALPFYEKRGYTVFSRLPDMPPGGARYALTKHLGD